MRIRPMREVDWPDVARIYLEGLETGNATFETELPDWATWDQGHLAECRLVADLGDEVVAWVALTPVSRREVYRGVVEHSIYVSRDGRGRGIGRALLMALIEAAEAAGFWTIQTSIFPENQASLTLHERCGFRVIGTRERVAMHDGRWRDTILMERRSAVVGN